jgi:hypothetical protein
MVGIYWFIPPFLGNLLAPWGVPWARNGVEKAKIDPQLQPCSTGFPARPKNKVAGGAPVGKVVVGLYWFMPPFLGIFLAIPGDPGARNGVVNA